MNVASKSTATLEQVGEQVMQKGYSQLREMSTILYKGVFKYLGESRELK